MIEPIDIVVTYVSCCFQPITMCSRFGCHHGLERQNALDFRAFKESRKAGGLLSEKNKHWDEYLRSALRLLNVVVSSKR